MDVAPPMGATVRDRTDRQGTIHRKMGTTPFLVALATLLVASAPATLAAAERYAIIVSGASGDPKFAATYDKWRAELTTIFRDKLKFDGEHLFVLGETASTGVLPASRQQLKTTMERVAKRATTIDTVVVILMGHGSSDGAQAKFNLVGPDLDADEWSTMLSSIAGRLVLINTTSASFPFLEKVSRKGRIVVTATDTASQRYETVFPEHFVKAFSDPLADVDKNDRISIWEAFSFASAGVKQHYEQRGQLATERAVLDDDGDKKGQLAEAPGPDGVLARSTFLDPDIVAPANASAEVTALFKRRDGVLAQIEALKTRKDATPLEVYESELEKLLLELATISRQIKEKGSQEPPAPIK